MPMDRARYPDNWEKIALAVKTAAGWKCQKCGKQCRKPGEPFDTHKRTLTVAHLNHMPEDVREENLMAMCAPCHLRYDAKHHAETRKRKRGNVMAEQVFIRAEIIGTLPSGQKRIHLLAGVDGMVFTTDESQLIRPDEQFVPRKWIEAYAGKNTPYNKSYHYSFYRNRASEFEIMKWKKGGTQYRERYTSNIICAEGGAFDIFIHSYVEYKQGGAWKTCKGASKNTDGMAMCKDFARYLWSCADPGCPVVIM